MTKSNLLMMATMAATAAIIAHTARANPVDPVAIGYCLNGPCQVPTTLNQNGGSASTAGNIAVGGFTINMEATGSPALSEPGLDSNQITVASNTGGTIWLYATEADMTAFQEAFVTGFENNSGSDATVLERSYVDNNSYYGQTYLVGSADVAPGAATTNQITARPDTLNGPYSMTEAFGITLDAGQSVNATMSMRGIATPEPMSLSLMGVGLIGLAYMRRRV